MGCARVRLCKGGVKGRAIRDYCGLAMGFGLGCKRSLIRKTPINWVNGQG